MPGTQSGSRSRVVLLSIFLLGLSGYGAMAAMGKVSLPTFLTVPTKQPTETKPFDPSVWAWRNEEHWVVDQTARDIGEMLCVAAGEKPEAYRFTTQPDPKAPHSYLLRAEGPKLGRPIEQSFVIRAWTWDPGDFKDWTHALAQGLRVKPGPSDLPLSSAVADQLLRPDEVTVSDASLRVSAALNRDPASADVHDAAGAVLVAFSLFDDPGVFVDHRHALCRLSAHAAVAAELRAGTPGPSEALSRLGLLALTSRSQACTDEIARMERGQSSGLAPAWLNAVKMLATGDWRGAADAKRVTDAERLASFAGRCSGLSAQQALDWALPGEGESPHAFLYHEASNWDESVDLRGEAISKAYQMDMALIVKLSPGLLAGMPQERTAVISALNAHAGRCYDPATKRLQVLGWGDWAQRLQAGLLDDMMRTIDYYSSFQGSKESTDAYIARIEREFGGLEQFPVLQKRYANLKPSIYPAAIQRVAQLLRDHPEIVADGNFPCLDETTPGGAPPRSMATYRQWETLPLPYGTAYNAFKRCGELHEWRAMTSQDYLKIRAVDPWNIWLRRCVLEKTAAPGKHPSPQAVEEAFGAIKDFAPSLYLNWMDYAYPPESPGRIPVLEQKAQQDPGAYLQLSWLYVELNREPEALQAALKGYELDWDRDAVRVSNNMLWAVRYLYRTGQASKAESIAEACGDTGSAMGMRTLAVLRELQGRYPDAEELYAQIRDRYQDNDPYTFGLYARNAARDPGMRAKYDEATRKLFPRGLRAWSPADEASPPAKGVQLDRTPQWAQNEGLTPGAVIVAFDGKKVESIAQYEAVRDVDLDDRFTVTVYQGGKYQTLSLEAVNRRFGVGLLDYPR